MNRMLVSMVALTPNHRANVMIALEIPLGLI